MRSENPVTLSIDALEFNEFGAYEVAKVLTDDELDFISGGGIWDITINKCDTNNCSNSGCGKNDPWGQDEDFNI